ncbi:hypothetical protein BLOT_016315 [Blomia tropicalis]|nr:hypothetical protein BLOT_016315 [Blomia tropicalis]
MKQREKKEKKRPPIGKGLCRRDNIESNIQQELTELEEREQDIYIKRMETLINYKRGSLAENELATGPVLVFSAMDKKEEEKYFTSSSSSLRLYNRMKKNDFQYWRNQETKRKRHGALYLRPMIASYE